MIHSFYYLVVVLKSLSKDLCYNVRDAVDWFSISTARRCTKGYNHMFRVKLFVQKFVRDL